VLYFPADGVPD